MVTGPVFKSHLEEEKEEKMELNDSSEFSNDGRVN